MIILLLGTEKNYDSEYGGTRLDWLIIVADNSIPVTIIVLKRKKKHNILIKQLLHTIFINTLRYR